MPWKNLYNFLLLVIGWFSGFKDFLFNLVFAEIRIHNPGKMTHSLFGEAKGFGFSFEYYWNKPRFGRMNAVDTLKDRKNWIIVGNTPVKIAASGETSGFSVLKIWYLKHFLKLDTLLRYFYELETETFSLGGLEDENICKTCLQGFSMFLAYPPVEEFLGTFDKCIHKDTEANYFWDKECERLLKEVKNFLSSKNWYKERGIPYRLGILLHGAPGNGKSRFIDYLVKYHDLTKYVLANEKDTKRLIKNREGYFGIGGGCLVMEDFDCVFEKRKNVSDTLKGDLSDVFKIIDEHEGLVIVTTNHLELIDPAIGLPEKGKSTRPGRIHRILEMGPPSEEVRRKIAKKILYGFEGQVEEFVSAGKGETYAQFTDRCSSWALNRYWELA